MQIKRIVCFKKKKHFDRFPSKQCLNSGKQQLETLTRPCDFRGAETKRVPGGEKGGIHLMQQRQQKKKT